MAFIKNTNFAFELETNPPTSVKDGKVSIPLVFTKEEGKIHGFVPGIVMSDIVEDNIELCQKKLLNFVKVDVKNKKDANAPFPFFPTNEQIKKDFKHVVLIKRISVII